MDGLQKNKTSFFFKIQKPDLHQQTQSSGHTVPAGSVVGKLGLPLVQFGGELLSDLLQSSQPFLLPGAALAPKADSRVGANY